MWKETSQRFFVCPCYRILSLQSIERLSAGQQEVLEKKLIRHWDIDFGLQELCWYSVPKGQELTLSSIKLDNKWTQNFNFESFAVRWDRGTKQNSFYSFRSGLKHVSLSRFPSGSTWGIWTRWEVWSQKAWLLEIWENIKSHIPFSSLLSPMTN